MKPDQKLDLRQISIPICLLEFKRTLQAMEPGKVMEVFVGDEETLEDIEKIVDRSPDRIIKMAAIGGHYRALVKKGE
jgi:TusA-related sulfurtransferase